MFPLTDGWASAWGKALDLTAGWLAGAGQAQQATWTAAARHVELMARTTARLMGAPAADTAPAPADRRFENRAWRENPAFDMLRQSYLINAQWLLDLADGLAEVNPDLHKRVRFWTQQAVDALSPSNYALTNPEVLQETLATGGQNLVRGAQSLLADLQQGRITMVPEGSFEVGKDLAVTPGQVVFRNDLIELIQYAAATPQVRAAPILIAPPWINKYYVMDLRPANSLYRHLVEAGFTVFTISWKNPSPGDPALGMDLADYVEQGLLAGLAVVRDITGQEKAGVVGYCVGGILVQAGLAYLAATGELPVSSATFFATHQDFSQAGDLEVFLGVPEVAFVELLMQASGGYLDGRNLAATFNLLRANDLLWQYVVNNYLLGREPPAFDLLYWNSDGTRVPAPVHATLLRELFLGNKLREPGGLRIRGVGLDTRRVAVPIYAVAGSTDHIVPWRGAFEAPRQFPGPVRFVLAESGHIAAIINPPASGKRSYWTNEDATASAEQWLAGAVQHKGSWWPDWTRWLEERSGELVAPPAMGSAAHPPLAPAPGAYVLER